MTITYRLSGPLRSSPWALGLLYAHLRPAPALGMDEVEDWRLVILRFSYWFWSNLFTITGALLVSFWHLCFLWFWIFLFFKDLVS